MRSYLSHALLVCLLASCSKPETAEDQTKRQFLDLAGIDSKIKPGDNFFMHVNGRWYDTARIADDQVGVGSYSFLNIPQRQLLKISWRKFQPKHIPKEAMSKK